MVISETFVAAGGQRLTDPEVLSREVLRALERGSLLLLVQRGRTGYHLQLEM